MTYEVFCMRSQRSYEISPDCVSIFEKRMILDECGESLFNVWGLGNKNYPAVEYGTLIRGDVHLSVVVDIIKKGITK